MSVFIDLIEAINCGKKVHINLVEKTVKINGNEIILDEKELIELNDINMIFATQPWDIVEELYSNFKRSVPSATTKTNKSYFHADSVEDLTDDEIAFNMSRDLAQILLEGYILLAGLSGWLQWQNDKHWFYQGTDPECVVLREWIERKDVCYNEQQK